MKTRLNKIWTLRCIASWVLFCYLALLNHVVLGHDHHHELSHHQAHCMVVTQDEVHLHAAELPSPECAICDELSRFSYDDGKLAELIVFERVLTQPRFLVSAQPRAPTQRAFLQRGPPILG